MKRISPTATTATAALLLLLWGVSWGSSYAHLGAWSLVIAFGIAAAKAVLVVLVFMEIALEKTSIHATLVVGVAMVATLVAFMVADVETRAPPELAVPRSHASSGRP
jgi:caa(3)-type oxidase subunit IV